MGVDPGERTLLELAPSRLLSFQYYFLILIFLAAALSLFLRLPWDPGEFLGRDMHIYGPALLLTLSFILFLMAEARRINHRYFIGETTISVRTGILSRKTQYLPYRQIERVEVDQSILGRMFNIGNVIIDTGDDTIRLRAVKAPDRVHKLVTEQIANLGGNARSPSAARIGP
jgi:membrane protein YdbS with pleckstrin-like domain